MAAPSPIRRIRNISGRHGIADDVTEDAQEIHVAVNKPAVESALQHMPDTIVFAVKPLAVHGIQLLHQPRERNVMRPQEQVCVIPHEAVSDAVDVETRRGVRQDFQKARAIFVVHEDPLLGVSP